MFLLIEAVIALIGCN